METGETALAAFLKLSAEVISPSSAAFKEYGQCRAEPKQAFLHGLGLFQQNLRSEFEIFLAFGIQIFLF